MSANSLDTELGRQLRALTREGMDNRETEAVVDGVGADTITVRLKAGGTRLRNVRVIGGVENLLVGDTVFLQRHGDVTLALNPRAVQGGSGLVQSAAHVHDDRYYSEAEVLALLEGKADASHNHAPAYIEAIGGTIGGFEIEADYLRDRLDTFGLAANVTSGDDVRFWAGAAYASRASAPFRVTEAGVVTATSGAIAGWIISATALTSPGSNLVLSSAGALRGNFVAGQTGWQVNEAGDAEFNNVTVRGALNTAVLIYNQVHATGGSLVIAKSAMKLRTTFTTLNSPTNFNVDVDDADGSTHGASQLAIAGDILRIKDGTADAWLLVDSVSDQTTFWRYVCSKSSPGAGTNYTFYAGAGIVNYGQSGQGFLWMTADNADGPFYSVRTHAGSPWTTTTEVGRLGNMRNAFGTGANNRYGFGVGDYAGLNYLSYNAESSGVFVLSAGGSNVLIDGANGVRLTSGASYEAKSSLKWVRGGNRVTEVFSFYDDPGNKDVLYLLGGRGAGSDGGEVYIAAQTPTPATTAFIQVTTDSGGTIFLEADNDVRITVDDDVVITAATGEIALTSPTVTVSGDIDLVSGNWVGLSGSAGRLVFTDAGTDTIDVETATLNTKLGLNVGTATGAGTGEIKLSGSILQSIGLGVRPYHDANQAIGNNAWTAVALNQENTDDGGLHSTSSNNSRLTVVVGGYYIITANLIWAANATGIRGIAIRYNGSLYIAFDVDNNIGAVDMGMSVATILRMNNPGDYVEMMAYQNSGGNLNVLTSGAILPSLSMVRIP